MNNTENSVQENPEPAEVKSKKKSHKKFIIPLIAVVILFTSVCGIVFAKKKFRDGPHGFMIEQMTRNLNLSESQKAQVEQLKAQIKEKMESNRPDRGNDMEEFANEFKKDNLDKNKLLELGKKKEQKMEEMKSFMMEKLIEFHDILTAEQRDQVVENMKDMKNKFHEGIEKFRDKKEQKD